MNIIILGAGRIGSVFAFHLALADHEVTVVARGSRLEALRRDNAVVTTDGRRAPVSVMSALDQKMPYDLVIVTVPEYQVEPLIPQLAASAAKTIVLLFNSFYGTERYRIALGGERLAVGFPNMTAFLEADRLRYKVNSPGMMTTLSNMQLAQLFKRAGLPTQVEADMDAYLRSHVAMVVPIFLAALLTWPRNSALTWPEAKRLSAAWTEGFNLVRSLGNVVRPRFLAVFSRMPSLALTALLWTFSRSASVRNNGQFGPTEARWLIDAMVAFAPDRTPGLLAIRP